MHPRQFDATGPPAARGGLRTTDADLRALALLGRAIRVARMRAGVSQRRLAAESGVSQSAISRVERGAVRGLHLRYFARVIVALGDSMPLVGCPHGHDCDYAREWRAARAQVSFDARERERVAHEGATRYEHEGATRYEHEGATLYELVRRAERAGELDELGNPIDVPADARGARPA